MDVSLLCSTSVAALLTKTQYPFLWIRERELCRFPCFIILFFSLLWHWTCDDPMPDLFIPADSHVPTPLYVIVLKLQMQVRSWVGYVILLLNYSCVTLICWSADKCPRYPLSRAAWPWKWRHSLQVSICWLWRLCTNQTPMDVDTYDNR